MVLGTLVGLPALRLSGLYLALITLMLAGAITVVLTTINFPNGGGGFTGYDGATVHIPPIRRPSIGTTEPAFFRYSMIVAILMFAPCVLPHPRAPGTSVGGDPTERIGGAGGTSFTCRAVRMAGGSRGRFRATLHGSCEPGDFVLWPMESGPSFEACAANPPAGAKAGHFSPDFVRCANHTADGYTPLQCARCCAFRHGYPHGGRGDPCRGA